MCIVTTLLHCTHHQACVCLLSTERRNLTHSPRFFWTGSSIQALYRGALAREKFPECLWAIKMMRAERQVEVQEAVMIRLQVGHVYLPRCAS